MGRAASRKLKNSFLKDIEDLVVTNDTEQWTNVAHKDPNGDVERVVKNMQSIWREYRFHKALAVALHACRDIRHLHSDRHGFGGICRQSKHGGPKYSCYYYQWRIVHCGLKFRAIVQELAYVYMKAMMYDATPSEWRLKNLSTDVYMEQISREYNKAGHWLYIQNIVECKETRKQDLAIRVLQTCWSKYRAKKLAKSCVFNVISFTKITGIHPCNDGTDWYKVPQVDVEYHFDMRIDGKTYFWRTAPFGEEVEKECEWYFDKSFEFIHYNTGWSNRLGRRYFNVVDLYDDVHHHVPRCDMPGLIRDETEREESAKKIQKQWRSTRYFYLQPLPTTDSVPNIYGTPKLKEPWSQKPHFGMVYKHVRSKLGVPSVCSDDCDLHGGPCERVQMRWILTKDSIVWYSRIGFRTLIHTWDEGRDYTKIKAENVNMFRV